MAGDEYLQYQNLPVVQCLTRFRPLLCCQGLGDFASPGTQSWVQHSPNGSILHVRAGLVLGVLVSVLLPGDTGKAELSCPQSGLRAAALQKACLIHFS